MILKSVICVISEAKQIEAQITIDSFFSYLQFGNIPILYSLLPTYIVTV